MNHFIECVFPASLGDRNDLPIRPESDLSILDLSKVPTGLGEDLLLQYRVPPSMGCPPPHGSSPTTPSPLHGHVHRPLSQPQLASLPDCGPGGATTSQSRQPSRPIPPSVVWVWRRQIIWVAPRGVAESSPRRTRCRASRPSPALWLSSSSSAGAGGGGSFQKCNVLSFCLVFVCILILL